MRWRDVAGGLVGWLAALALIFVRLFIWLLVLLFVFVIDLAGFVLFALAFAGGLFVLLFFIRMGNKVLV